MAFKKIRGSPVLRFGEHRSLAGDRSCLVPRNRGPAGGEHLHSAATPTLIADLVSVGVPVATVVFGASA